MPRRVRLLATGGTISTTTDPASGRSAPTLGAAVGDLANVPGVEVEVAEITRRPSWALDPADMADLARRAAEASRDPATDGVVITHGTTTLEYTAFLVSLLETGDAPVVLTGAMRRADEPAPDGPANLRDAIVVAASELTRGLGAAVVFAGQVIEAGRAWKANRSDVDAFVDLSGAPLGTVTDGKVSIARRVRRQRRFSGRLEPRVRLVKLVPGDDGAQLEGLGAEIRGLVVEALPGAGGVPPGALAALRARADQMPVVIAPRAPFGRQSVEPTGGTGEPLAGLPLLSAGRLTAEQAWLLLMVVLGEVDGGDRPAVRQAFEAIAAAPD